MPLIHLTPAEHAEYAAFLSGTHQPPVHIHVTGDLHLTLQVTPPADPAQITGPILAALAHTQGALMTDIHADLAAVLDQIEQAEAAETADLTRELADFAADVAPQLSDAEQARFAAILQAAKDRDAAILAADPAPVVTTPGDGDGSGDQTTPEGDGTAPVSE